MSHVASLELLARRGPSQTTMLCGLAYLVLSQISDPLLSASAPPSQPPQPPVVTPQSAPVVTPQIAPPSLPPCVHMRGRVMRYCSPAFSQTSDQPQTIVIGISGLVFIILGMSIFSARWRRNLPSSKSTTPEQPTPDVLTVDIDDVSADRNGLWVVHTEAGDVCVVYSPTGLAA